MTPNQAEAVAIKALAFVASEPELLSRFLSLTDIEAADIRQAAREPGFLAGVLQFVLAHEPTLLAFCDAAGVTPQETASAHTALPFGDERWDIQP